MKKALIVLLAVIISLGCLSSKTALPTEKELLSATTLPVEITETALPVEPTETSTPTKVVPTKTPKPTETPTTVPVDEIRARIADYANPELDALVDEFGQADYNTLDDTVLDGAATTNLFHLAYDFSPTEFLAITDVKWEHPTSNIRQSSSGCGYMFYDYDETHMYFVLFTLDNQARLTEVSSDYWYGVQHHQDNSLKLASPNGNAEMMMAMLGDRMVFAVNGKILIDYKTTWIAFGDFGYSMLSGTNKDYGTRCTFTNSVVLVNE